MGIDFRNLKKGTILSVVEKHFDIPCVENNQFDYEFVSFEDNPKKKKDFQLKMIPIDKETRMKGRERGFDYVPRYNETFEIKKYGS